jgi:hypothetical protein
MGSPKGHNRPYGAGLSGQIRFRARPVDKRRLRALANRWECSPSEVMRRLLAREAEGVN